MATAEAFEAYMRDVQNSTARRVGGELDILGTLGNKKSGLRLGAVWYTSKPSNHVRGHIALSGLKERHSIIVLPEVPAEYHTVSGTSWIGCEVPASEEWLELGAPYLLGQLIFRSAEGHQFQLGALGGRRAKREAAAALAGATAFLRADTRQFLGEVPIISDSSFVTPVTVLSI